MKAYATGDLRNVALIGHGASGKTTLASALLFAAGAVKRFGKVDEGGAVTDFDEEEVERKTSIQTAMAHLEFKGRKINLLDTPGFAAFVADALPALRVADSALLVVDGVAGVEVITRRTFRYAEAEQLPLAFVIGKLDRENSSFARALESIQERFGRAAVPFHLPLGEEHGFRGVVDLVSMRAHLYERDGSGKATEADVPAEAAEAAGAARAALVEMIAETDDALMEVFFESGDLDATQISNGVRSAVRRRKIFPVFAASALHAIGPQSLLQAICDLLPAPGELRPATGKAPDGDEAIERPVEDGQPLSLLVFKTLADPFAGRLSMFRVATGLLKGDSSVVNVRTGATERMSNAGLLQGRQVVQVEALHAGDLGAVVKLKDTHTCDTLSDPAHRIVYPAIEFPPPSISYAIEPKSKGDEEKIATALHRLAEEDPVLRVTRDAQTGEQIVSGASQIHVEVALSRMKRKFGAEALLHPPRVPYRETIRRKVEHVEGKHKKQSGGRGQFGVCVIHMEPLPAGSGIEFVDKIFGGSIPQNYRPAVEKGIREAAARGYLAGYPVVDFRVTLVDGKYHTVDSSEMAFKIAGSLAFKAAMEKVEPTLLEPIMNVEITSPEEYMGDIMGDLSSRRGKPQGMESDGAYQVIHAQVPLAEMLTYASTLKSITSDRASYHMEFDHYDEVPAQVRQQVVAEAAKQQES